MIEDVAVAFDFVQKIFPKIVHKYKVRWHERSEIVINV